MMPNNNPQKVERFEGKQGGERHLFAVNKISICRQPHQNKLQITLRILTGKVHCLSVYQYSSLFRLKLLEIKTNTLINSHSYILDICTGKVGLQA